MYLDNRSRYIIAAVAGIAVVMVAILGLHLFGSTVLKYGLYSQLFGALLGGTLAIISVNTPVRFGEEVEPWLGRERLAWTLIGIGAILWGLGECAYRFELAHNLPNFPAVSDIGYSALPPFIFAGLLLQPYSDEERGRYMVLLDSLISMGAILSIAWFLLLGSMAQAPSEANLAKFLGLYYPISDMALLSCVVFLFLRGRGRVFESQARRWGLILVALGICVFAVSDFNYNIQNNMGTYVDGTWADLGWPLGLMLIGVAAHLRRFMHATPSDLVEERVRRHNDRNSFGVAQLVPYLLLGALLLVLIVNVLSHDPTQVWNRPVLLFATVGVVALVVVRQLITQLENESLSRRQTISLERLAAANARVEEQARTIAEYNANLEEGIAHLKEVQAQLANGNLRARARITGGNLVSLAGSFNLMADRLLRFEQVDGYAQKLARALNELSRAFEVYRNSGRFTLPPSCAEFPEIQRLLISMGMKQTTGVGSNEQMPGGPVSQPGVARSSSKPLSQTPIQRPSSSPLANRSNSAPLTPRSSSSPLAPGQQRPQSQQQRPQSFHGSNESGKPTEPGQIDFPPLPPWGNS